MALSKITLLAATSAIALLAAAPVSAADDKRSPSALHGMVQTQIKANQLIGKNLKNLAGETIGDIESVIIDKNGKVAAVIVGVGGFLGMGERQVAIDWNDIRIRRNGKVIQTRLTTNDLKARPQYKYAKPENRRKAFEDRRYVDKRTDGKNRRGAMSEWIPTSALRVSKLIGVDVVNSGGEAIGEVEDLIVANNRTQLILAVGEFLGMGGRFVTLDLDKAQVHRQRGDADDLRLSVSMTKKQLMAQPQFDSYRWEKGKGMPK